MLTTNEIFKQQLSKGGTLHQLTDEELKKMQKTVLDIADDVIDLCNEHNIPYSLAGGTALGAIRHRGFIPWDDDFDLVIEDKYMNLLCASIEKELGDKYSVSIPGMTPGYYSTFYQVHKQGTVCREDKHTPDSLCGIKVDIFPLFSTYDGFIARVLHGLLCDAGSFALSCMRMRLYKDEYLSLAMANKRAYKIISIKSVLGLLPSLFPQKMVSYVMKVHGMCANLNTKYITCPSGRKHFAGETRCRKYALEAKLILFENKRYRLSRDVKTYLRSLYGSDYMILPPENKREKHIVYELDFGD